MHLHTSVYRLIVSFVMCGLMLAVAIPAAAQTRLYEVELDLFSNDEMTHSLSVVLEEGKSARVSIGETSIVLLVASEGSIKGEPTISLSLDVTKTEEGLQNGTESQSVLSPTFLLSDTMEKGDPVVASVGSSDVAISVRRIEPSRVKEIMQTSDQASDCQPGNSETMAIMARLAARSVVA